MSCSCSKTRVGYFGGSFNPIHEGHIRLAEHLLSSRLVEEVWFVVSPQNPLKATADPSDAARRLAEVGKALANHPGMYVSDFECTLPVPSYTVDCLKAASASYYYTDFVLVIGGDNLDVFKQWKDYTYLLEHFDIIVYPRSGATNKVPDGWNRVKMLDAPLMDVSSSHIRATKGIG